MVNKYGFYREPRFKFIKKYIGLFLLSFAAIVMILVLLAI
jgi:hypothetical protein